MSSDETGSATSGEVELPDAARELLDTHSRAFLMTLRADGSPTAHPMTALRDGTRLLFNTYRKSAKARNLERDPRVGVLLVNGYEAERPDEVRGLALRGRGRVRQADALPETRGPSGQAQVSPELAQRAQARVASGKRVLLDVLPDAVEPLEPR